MNYSGRWGDIIDLTWSSINEPQIAIRTGSNAVPTGFNIRDIILGYKTCLRRDFAYFLENLQ